VLVDLLVSPEPLAPPEPSAPVPLVVAPASELSLEVLAAPDPYVDAELAPAGSDVEPCL